MRPGERPCQQACCTLPGRCVIVPRMTELQLLIRQSGITQERVAIEMGIDPSMLSRIVRGLRPAPNDFESKLKETIEGMTNAV